MAKLKLKAMTITKEMKYVDINFTKYIQNLYTQTQILSRTIRNC